MKRLPIIATVALYLTMTAIAARAADPRVDLRDLNDTDLQEAAQTDAQEYFASHTDINTAYTGEIGTAHAIHHHLLGDQLQTYEVAFFETLDALIDDKD
jgi:hypothetical protein